MDAIDCAVDSRQTEVDDGRITIRNSGHLTPVARVRVTLPISS